MPLISIETEHQYDEALAWLDAQFDLRIDPESKQGKAIQQVLVEVKNYEDIHYPIPTA